MIKEPLKTNVFMTWILNIFIISNNDRDKLQLLIKKISKER
jgi:hypothetical protein